VYCVLEKKKEVKQHDSVKSGKLRCTSRIVSRFTTQKQAFRWLYIHSETYSENLISISFLVIILQYVLSWNAPTAPLMVFKSGYSVTHRVFKCESNGLRQIYEKLTEITRTLLLLPC
jgi:hypothetical protein